MASQEYDLARIAAIKAYADLEHRLAYLLSKLIPCDADTAWTIFFRISATRARYAIIGDLMKFKFDGAYRKAWERIEEWLRPLDTKRNHIVHWSEVPITVVNALADPPAVSTTHGLQQPAHYFRRGAVQYSQKELVAFEVDVEEMEQVINLFGLAIHGATALRGIFQQPLGHPTPGDLLQDLRNAIRQAPPEPSQA